jgi:hypothetical protein
MTANASDAAAAPLGLRRATMHDLPAIRAVIGAAYARYLSRMDKPPAPDVPRLRALGRSRHDVGHRLSHHGYVEVERRAEDGYRRIYMEKPLTG